MGAYPKLVPFEHKTSPVFQDEPMSGQVAVRNADEEAAVKAGTATFIKTRSAQGWRVEIAGIPAKAPKKAPKKPA